MGKILLVNSVRGDPLPVAKRTELKQERRRGGEGGLFCSFLTKNLARPHPPPH